MSVCRRTCWCLEPARIHLLRFVLEGYEGLGQVTTLDARRGLVRLSAALGGEADLDELMRALTSELRLSPCAEPAEAQEALEKE